MGIFVTLLYLITICVEGVGQHGGRGDVVVSHLGGQEGVIVNGQGMGLLQGIMVDFPRGDVAGWASWGWTFNIHPNWAD